jgi:hypothetical protein
LHIELIAFLQAINSDGVIKASECKKLSIGSFLHSALANANAE